MVKKNHGIIPRNDSTSLSTSIDILDTKSCVFHRSAPASPAVLSRPRTAAWALASAEGTANLRSSTHKICGQNPNKVEFMYLLASLRKIAP